jgi:site-specific recombinase XerD
MNTVALHTPQPDLSAILNANLQPTTKMQYCKAIRNMIEAGVDPRNHEQLRNYATALPSSSRAFLKSALALLTSGIQQELKANATPGNVQQVQASLYRLEAMQDVIQVSQPKGEKAHLWLSREQVEQITALPGDDIEGKRDWIVLGLLLGAGLRREELAQLTFEAIKQQPSKHGQVRHVLQVTGKGAKDRVIPISQILADRLNEWNTLAGDGFIARSFARGKLGESLSAVGIFGIVSRYGEAIGLPELAPHDLRRTFAQLGYEAGVPITQISKLLGHADVSTTQQYLNLELNLETTVSDAIPLSGD